LLIDILFITLMYVYTYTMALSRFMALCICSYYEVWI